MNKKRATVYFVSTLAVFAGIEAGCIIPFTRLYEKGIEWPTTLVGIIAAVLLGVGLLPPYWEIYKRGGQVVGINFIFLTIDSGGALFSTLSLVFQKGSLDILGCVLYIVILVLEGGIFLSQAIWLLRTRIVRRAASEERVCCDEVGSGLKGDKLVLSEAIPDENEIV
ncbi:hypothetical protein AWJ20_3978 [Sugiyamaella lignohabitans]|uniref:PQ loop repeat protein n=1 Tax=Sugiyamaella lignohabitans TaxID=796027 RepID=A0A167C3N3_9ASCO|nr:uncharacterized protein AWJ20_3978 [Sugiyamaella lignohabitans]ANB11176.1 hypothetical protein AWJ20_3978 [Sugiyamaella lignohabitans]